MACLHLSVMSPRVEVSKRIEPFFMADPSLPPSLPLLVAQTDVHYHVLHPRSLVAQEEIRSPIRGSRVVRRPTPYSRTGPATIRFTVPSLREEPSLTSVSQHASREGTPESKNIPKPPGEAGRPGRGGYNLEHVLAWDGSQLDLLKVSFRSFFK